MRQTKDKDKLTRLKVELSDVENKINDSLKQKRDKEEFFGDYTEVVFI